MSDNNVSSAAGITFDPIEYKIKPEQTKNPCNEIKPLLWLELKKGSSVANIIIVEKTTQKKPAKDTVVNFGVSFFHLKVTEKIEKAIDETTPKTKPSNDAFSEFPNAIIINPIAARKIEIQTLKVIFSLRKRNPNRAVKKGIAAKQSNVTAALVFVIE